MPQLPLFARRLLAPVELKLVLSALKDERRHLSEESGIGLAIGIDLIAPKVSQDIWRWTSEIRKDIHGGKAPRAVVLWLMMNVARDYLASGSFHVFPGRLSMQGIGIKAINSYCLSELTKLGSMTADEKRAAISATNEDIRAVG